jgi:hypothetical protein
LKWVEKMPQLKHLICNNCREIDSVDGLFERSALETLDLQGCEKIPELDWQKLLSSNPLIKGSGPCIVPISVGEINEFKPAIIIKV